MPNEEIKQNDESVGTNTVSEEISAEKGNIEQESSSNDIEELVNKAVNKAVEKIEYENNKLKKQLEKMKTEKLTDDERKQFEIEEKEIQITEREKVLKEKENRLYAVKALKKAGLDDGGEDSLELVDFILSEDVDSIDSKAATLKKLIDKKVKSEVDKRFKECGRSPSIGNSVSNTDNPYLRDSWNFTKQCEIELSNPELSKSLKAAAGIK